MKKYKKSTIIPCALLVYLAIMAYIGRDYYYAGEKTFYFGVILGTLSVIAILYFCLRKKEKFQKEREDDIKKGE